MSYVAANQLSAHTDTALAVPAPVTMTAQYDGASRRVKQVAGGVTRYSVYDASGTLIEIDEVGGAKTDYIRASGMTLARIAGTNVTWLHHDHLGSAVAATNSAGTVVWRESEQPFGEDWTSAAANDNQPGYTGHVEDAATGLVYMQARYYDPVIGRFLSIDPVGFTPGRPDMFNRYAYAGNDPVNLLDPDGRLSCPKGKTCKDIPPASAEVRKAAIKAISSAHVSPGRKEEGSVVTTSEATGKVTEVIEGKAAGKGEKGEFKFAYRPLVGSKTAATAHSHGKGDRSTVAGRTSSKDSVNRFPSPHDLKNTMNQTNASIFVHGTDGTITETFRDGNTDVIVPWVEGTRGPITTDSLPRNIARDTEVMSPDEFMEKYGDE